MPKNLNEVLHAIVDKTSFNDESDRATSHAVIDAEVPATDPKIETAPAN